jgi:hypothetical protein
MTKQRILDYKNCPPKMGPFNQVPEEGRKEVSMCELEGI